MIHFFQGLAIGSAYVAPIDLRIFVINTALTSLCDGICYSIDYVDFFDVTLALACFWGSRRYYVCCQMA